MSADLVTPLLNLGLPGVAIVALAWAYLKRDKQLAESQEARIQEAIKGVTALEQNTAALEALTEVLRKQRRPT